MLLPMRVLRSTVFRALRSHLLGRRPGSLRSVTSRALDGRRFGCTFLDTDELEYARRERM